MNLLSTSILLLLCGINDKLLPLPLPFFYIRTQHLVLEQSQATLDNNVLKDGSRRNINGVALGCNNDDGTLEGDAAAKVDGTGNGQVVELKNLGDRRNARLEAGNLLEVTTKLDERSWAETGRVDHELTVLEGVEVRLDEHEVGAGLDGKETTTGNVDTVGVVEVADGGTDSSLELDNANVGLTLLVGRDRLAVGNDLHGEFVALDNALDGAEVHPDVVGVEVLELLDRLELVDVLLGNLGDFEETSLALVVNDGTTLDVGLGLVGQLHEVLGLGVHHVLENLEINDSAEVVSVGKEDNLDTASKKLVEDAGVVEGLENVTVSGGVPVGKLGAGGLWCGELRVLEDTGVSGLVEGHDVDVVALVLLDDVGGIGVGVERVHENERNVDVVGAVEVLNLADRKVEEGHTITDLNDRLGTNATHGGTETTVELEDGELAEELNRLILGEVLVGDDLLRLWGSNARPFNLVALGLVVQVSAEESKEVVHLSLEALCILLDVLFLALACIVTDLLLAAVLDAVDELVEGVAHLGCGN